MTTCPTARRSPRRPSRMEFCTLPAGHLEHCDFEEAGQDEAEQAAARAALLAAADQLATEGWSGHMLAVRRLRELAKEV